MSLKGDSGEHRTLPLKIKFLERKLERLERQLESDLISIRLEFKRHAEQDVKMHGEVMEALRVYHFAGLGLRTIRWLAVVGAAIAAILGMLKGWGK